MCDWRRKKGRGSLLLERKQNQRAERTSSFVDELFKGSVSGTMLWNAITWLILTSVAYQFQSLHILWKAARAISPRNRMNSSRITRLDQNVATHFDYLLLQFCSPFFPSFRGEKQQIERKVGENCVDDKSSQIYVSYVNWFPLKLRKWPGFSHQDSDRTRGRKQFKRNGGKLGDTCSDEKFSPPGWTRWKISDIAGRYPGIWILGDPASIFLKGERATFYKVVVPFCFTKIHFDLAGYIRLTRNKLQNYTNYAIATYVIREFTITIRIQLRDIILFRK